jgi:predicted N-acyltransferase
MPYRVTSVASIADIGTHVWDKLARSASVYSSGPWLRYVETHPDAQVSYLLASDGDRVAAALPVYCFQREVPLYYDPGFLFSDSGNGRSPGSVLVAGTREGYHSEVLIAESVPPPDRADIAAALVAELRRRSGGNGGTAAVLYLPDPDADLLASARESGDRLAVIDAQAVLDVPGDGLEAYLGGLSHNRRHMARREIRRFEKSGCGFRVGTLSECADRIGGLSAQLLNKYGHDADPEEESERFGRQAGLIDEISTVLCAYSGDTIVGFVHFIEWQDMLYARAIGFDYSAARTASLYFNLLYYKAVEYAAERGVKAIDYGCGSADTKVIRGARLRPLWGLLLDAPAPDVGAARERRELASFAELDPAVVTGTVERRSPEMARWAREAGK